MLKEKLNGKELYKIYPDIDYDEYNNEKINFILQSISKELLYKNNLCSIYNYFDEDEENISDRHENTIYGMIEYLRTGGILPPIIIDKEGCLIDGSHRLTAYSMMNEIKNIDIYQELS